MSPVDAALLQAYRLARYEVAPPGGAAIRLRVDAPCPALDAALDAAGFAQAALLAADNPFGVLCSEAENAAARVALDAALAAAGVRAWPGVGGEPEPPPSDAGQERWPDEVHRLALGLDPERALSWGVRLRQNAVLHLRRGGAVRLLLCPIGDEEPTRGR